MSNIATLIEKSVTTFSSYFCHSSYYLYCIALEDVSPVHVALSHAEPACSVTDDGPVSNFTSS